MLVVMSGFRKKKPQCYSRSEYHGIGLLKYMAVFTEGGSIRYLRGQSLLANLSLLITEIYLFDKETRAWLFSRLFA